MVKYRHLFFDLDRTLWDFERNSSETLTEIIENIPLLKTKNITAHRFIEAYKKINAEMWRAYRMNEISKEQLRRERFHQTMLLYNLDEPELALNINEKYVSNCSSKPHLIEGGKEMLELLGKKYILHIITNGFSEAQMIKLKAAGIKSYFQEIIISDLLGIKKPDPKIFEHALTNSRADKNESLMIGDDYEADIIGAQNAGIDQVYFTPEIASRRKATFVINRLAELRDIL
jgi:putative hydrolase of the HAD superfamily